MQVIENFSLKSYNTFGIDASARYFSAFQSMDELEELLVNSAKANDRLILGGGSNILFTRNVDGWVLKNEISGIEKFHEDDEFIYVRVGAGENWHRFVMHCIQNHWAGVENLSLIPGNTGASPMQNIGAYGVEIKDVFYELDAFHKLDRKLVKFGLKDCEFGYRESVFKQRFKDQFVILKVSFRLRKQPVFNTSYGAIEEELKRMSVQTLSVAAISQAVINIRTNKLPDPTIIGNAGSFFKNPEIDETQYKTLKSEYPTMVGYPLSDGSVKLAAGWLIEQCGWKGFRRGDAGCHAKQALVLVNYGHATGKEIYALSEEVQASVLQKFGVKLEREVNLF